MSFVNSPVHPSAKVHPSASIDPTARIGPGVNIEADVIVGPDCAIGAGTRLRTRSIILTRVEMGEGNDVHPYAVLGGEPQDRSYDPARPGEVIIGDRNVFREGVTIHRGNWNGGPTRIGSGCYLMALAHLGHNAVIGDNVTIANGSTLAGHARVGSGCVLSAYCAVHQFTNVGEGVMFRGGAMVSMHVPPYVVVAGENFIAGLNAVGLRRNPGLSPQDRDEIKQVFRVLYRERGAGNINEACLSLKARRWGEAATRFIDFVEEALTFEKPRSRGVCGGRRMKVRSPNVLAAFGDGASADA